MASDGKKYTVSVMITFYNQKPYVKECLDSIFAQKTDFDFEVLIGDDGSSDGTVEEIRAVCESYAKDYRIFIMPREKDKRYEPIERVSGNRINLLKNASGEYCIFFDGDDFFSDELKLQKQVDFLRSNPDCIACGHPIELYGEGVDSGTCLGKVADCTIKMKGKKFWKYCYLSSDTALFKNQLKSENVKTVKNFDDNMILLHVLSADEKSKIGILPDAMVKYRQLPDSSWNKRSEFEKVCINLKDYVEERIFFPEFRKQSFFRHFVEIKYLYLNRKKIPSCGKYEEDLKKDKILNDLLNYKEKSYIKKVAITVKYFYFIPYAVIRKIRYKIFNISLKLRSEKKQ